MFQSNFLSSLLDEIHVAQLGRFFLFAPLAFHHIALIFKTKTPKPILAPKNILSQTPNKKQWWWNKEEEGWVCVCADLEVFFSLKIIHGKNPEHLGRIAFSNSENEHIQTPAPPPLLGGEKIQNLLYEETSRLWGRKRRW